MLCFKQGLGLYLGRTDWGDAYRAALVFHCNASAILTKIGSVVVKKLSESASETRRLFLCVCHTDSLNSHRKLFCDLEIFLGALGALVVVIRRLSEAGSLGELYVTRYLCSEYFVLVVLFELGNYLH